MMMMMTMVIIPVPVIHQNKYGHYMSYIFHMRKDQLLF